jgi:hypothetical protein
MSTTAYDEMHPDKVLARPWMPRNLRCLVSANQVRQVIISFSRLFDSLKPQTLIHKVCAFTAKGMLEWERGFMLEKFSFDGIDEVL